MELGRGVDITRGGQYNMNMRKIDLRITEEQANLLAELAGILGTTRSELIRMAAEELSKFYKICRRNIKSEEDLKSVIEFFIASRLNQFVLEQDFRVLKSEMESMAGKALLEALKRRIRKRKEVKGKNG